MHQQWLYLTRKQSGLVCNLDRDLQRSKEDTITTLNFNHLLHKTGTELVNVGIITNVGKYTMEDNELYINNTIYRYILYIFAVLRLYRIYSEYLL